MSHEREKKRLFCKARTALPAQQQNTLIWLFCALLCHWTAALVSSEDVLHSEVHIEASCMTCFPPSIM